MTEAWLAATRQRLTEARRLARKAAEFAPRRSAGRLADLATRVKGPRAAVAARYAAALKADDAGELDRVSAEFEVLGDLLAAADAAGQAVVGFDEDRGDEPQQRATSD